MKAQEVCGGVVCIAHALSTTTLLSMQLHEGQHPFLDLHPQSLLLVQPKTLGKAMRPNMHCCQRALGLSLHPYRQVYMDFLVEMRVQLRMLRHGQCLVRCAVSH